MIREQDKAMRPQADARCRVCSGKGTVAKGCKTETCPACHGTGCQGGYKTK